MMGVIEGHTAGLFMNFDIFYAVFVTLCTLLLVFGILYLIRRLRN